MSLVDLAQLSLARRGQEGGPVVTWPRQASIRGVGPGDGHCRTARAGSRLVGADGSPIILAHGPVTRGHGRPRAASCGRRCPRDRPAPVRRQRVRRVSSTSRIASICVILEILARSDHVRPNQAPRATRIGQHVFGQEGRSPPSAPGPQFEFTTTPRRPIAAATRAPARPRAPLRDLLEEVGDIGGVCKGSVSAVDGSTSSHAATKCAAKLAAAGCRRARRAPRLFGASVLGSPDPCRTSCTAPPFFGAPRLWFVPNIGVTRAAYPDTGSLGRKTGCCMG